jgi:hypothetical protein
LAKRRKTLAGKGATYTPSGVNPIKLFSSENEDFFRFSLLSLSVCSIKKCYLYFKMANLIRENQKNEEIRFL